MKSLKHLAIALAIILLASCGTKEKKITSKRDYTGYLQNTESEMLQLAKSDLNFWEKKLEKEPNQFPYLAKAAASQSQIFNLTGKIESLKEAEIYLVKANEAALYNKADYLRALARNYISQHRFKEALGLLKKAELNGEHLKGTQKMLFDVHVELGNFELAKSYLDKIRKNGDFDYLIRLSKWSDHRGNIEAAIKYMEQAKNIAESSNIPATKQWVYTNLADYYGHAGRIQDSYQHYLKALELNPEDAYAKKGIAWIVYSYEKNPDEALNILNTITKNHKSPDYYLLKAEIAEFKGDLNLKKNELKLYNRAVNNPYTELEEAIAIATIEVENRPTPQSYDLLAWTYYKNGNNKEALKIAENYVAGKTFEPEVLFHLAYIYKANDKFKEVKNLKEELQESIFELGPVIATKVNDI